jgi:hypothetical protein
MEAGTIVVGSVIVVPDTEIVIFCLSYYELTLLYLYIYTSVIIHHISQFFHHLSVFC